MSDAQQVATHFLSGGGQGRHYVPLARDYSSLAYPATGPPGSAYCTNPQQAPISLERPSSRNPSNNNTNGQGQPLDATAASRISSASSSDNGGGGGGGGAAGAVAGAPGTGGGGANPLLSPCSVMEEASSPGSTTSQLSYLGALQSPASLTPLGFPTPYLLTKDGTHVGLGHVVNASGPKKKETKPGSDVRSFGCQVNFHTLHCLTTDLQKPRLPHPPPLLLQWLFGWILEMKRLFVFDHEAELVRQHRRSTRGNEPEGPQLGNRDTFETTGSRKERRWLVLIC